MDYSIPMRSLLTEVFACKQYKRLTPVAKVFGFIGVFPFIAAFAILYVVYNICVFLFNVLSTSVDYLENWQKKKTDGSGWFAEGIIHLVSLPFIFFCQIILSFISISFFFIWFFMQCMLYIATLGGIRWQPYITRINPEDAGQSYVATTNHTAGAIVTIVIGAIFLLYLILYFIGLDDYDVMYVAGIVNYIYILGTSITVPIVFKKKALKVSLDEENNVAEDNDDDDDDFALPTL